MTTPSSNRDKHHRFPVEIISHAAWLYFHFCLSYRDVEELLFARGVTLTYGAIRPWCRQCGQVYAHQLRRRRPRPGDTWHLDEVFPVIHGRRHYLWRAVDQSGNVLDILVQRRRNKTAAKKFFRKLLKRCRYVLRVIVTDRLKSCGAAKLEMLPGVEHRRHRYLNNRAENPPHPTASGSAGCRGLSHPGAPSGSWPPTVPSPRTSARDGIACLLRPLGKRCGTDSRLGRASRISPPPPKVYDRGQSCPFLSHNHGSGQQADKAASCAL